MAEELDPDNSSRLVSRLAEKLELGDGSWLLSLDGVEKCSGPKSSSSSDVISFLTTGDGAEVKENFLYDCDKKKKRA